MSKAVGTEYTKQFFKWLEIEPDALTVMEELSIGWILMLMCNEVRESGTTPDTFFWTEDDMDMLEWKILCAAYFGSDELDELVSHSLLNVRGAGKCASNSIESLALEYIKSYPMPGVSSYRLNVLLNKV